MVRGHVVDQAVQPRCVLDHQLIERRGLARLGARDQLLVFVRSRLFHRVPFRLNTPPRGRRQKIGEAITRRRQSDGWIHLFRRRHARLAAIADREKIEQISQGGDKRGHVGQRGGVQDFVYPDDFIPWLHDAHLLQNNFGPSRRIELDW